mmetsp:Transcript_7673/g.21775  ORF Transcript_7673/g.21775 Transcript_7673/m.21775 type:complete len:165 (+) Transcript_7673:75-569(+)
MAQFINLKDLVNTSGAVALNESPDHPLRPELLRDPQCELTLESDADEELLLFVPFSQCVRINSLALRAVVGSGPKRVAVFANGRGLSFDDVQALKPTQVLDLGPADVRDGTQIKLNYHEFQKIDCVTLYISQNQDDDDVTALSSVAFFGSPHGVMNVNEIQKRG